MKLGCCTWNFMTEFPSPPEEAIATIAGLGFEAFELIVFSRDEMLENYTPDKINRLRAYYQGYGLVLSEFVIDSGALRGLARPKEEDIQAALATFELGVSVARDLGAELVNFVPHWPEGLIAPHQYLPLYIHPVVHGAKRTAGPTWRLDLPDDFNWDRIWSHYVESLEACVAIAANNGVRLALEGHPHTILSSTDSFLRLFDRLDSPVLGVNLDTAMMAAIHREYPPVSIHKLGSRILHVHARDGDGLLNYSLPAGTGILDWPSILGSLRQVGFDGFVSVELGENCREPERHAESARRHLQTVLDEVDRNGAGHPRA
jgi:sugar phosphate isomerase/epimerase